MRYFNFTCIYYLSYALATDNGIPPRHQWQSHDTTPKIFMSVPRLKCAKLIYLTRVSISVISFHSIGKFSLKCHNLLVIQNSVDFVFQSPFY